MLTLPSGGLGASKPRTPCLPTGLGCLFGMSPAMLCGYN